MIENVKSGDKLTTGLVNDIIDAANGQMIPSTGSFRNENNGTLFIEDTNFPDTNKFDDAPFFLQCIGFDQLHYKLQELPFKYGEIPTESNSIYINLGASYDTAKSLLRLNDKPVKDIIILRKDTEAVKMQKEWFDPANSTQLSSIIATNTGFLDLGLEDIIYSGFICSVNEDEQTINIDEPYYLITNYNLADTQIFEDNITPALQSVLTGSKFKSFKVTSLFNRTEPKKSTFVTNVVQNMVGDQYATIVFPVDTQVKDIKLSSLELASKIEKQEIEQPNGSTEISSGEAQVFYQLVNFSDNENTITLPYEISALSGYNMVVRHYDDQTSAIGLEYASMNNFLRVPDSAISTINLSSLELKKHSLSGEQYFQLYKFDSDDLTDIDYHQMDKYNLIIRDATSDKKIIGYIPLSGMTLSGDADVENLDQFSIQSKVNDDGSKYFQLYNFDNADVVKPDNHILLAKNTDTKTLEYLEISSFSGISADSEVIEQFSIQKKKNNNDEYIQLYNFDKNSYVNFNKENHKVLVKNKEDNSLEYAELSNVVYEGDADVENVDQNSIQSKVNDDGSKYFQLYNFDTTSAYTSICADVHKILAKNINNNSLEYVELSSLSVDPLSGDSNLINSNQFSINVAKSDDGSKYIELYKFGDPTYSTDPIYYNETDYNIYSTNLPNAFGTLPSNDEDYDFVIRNNNTNSIEYHKINFSLPMPPVDSVVGSGSYSLGVESNTNGAGGNLECLALYNFKSPAETIYDANAFPSNGGNAFIVRSTVGNINTLRYLDPSAIDVLISRAGDSDISGNQSRYKSIDFVPKTESEFDKAYYQLYQFNDSSSGNSITATIHTDGKTYDVIKDKAITDSDYSSIPENHFLVRTRDSNGNSVLTYKQLFLKMPDISSEVIDGVVNDVTEIIERLDVAEGRIDDISSSLNDISSDLSDLSSDLSNYWIKDGSYSDNYGSSIGDSLQSMVIDLNQRRLVGFWSAEYFSPDSLDVLNSFTAQNGGQIYGGLHVTNGSIAIENGPLYVIGQNQESIFDGNVSIGGSLKIGETTITESQLQKLLALIDKQ